jgi:DNA-binding CsgD family transcriptional regulator
MKELTKREKEVMKELLEGKSNYEIGKALSIRTLTVRSHLYNIYNKTGIRSRTKIIAKHQQMPLFKEEER